MPPKPYKNSNILYSNSSVCASLGSKLMTTNRDLGVKMTHIAAGYALAASNAAKREAGKK